MKKRIIFLFRSGSRLLLLMLMTVMVPEVSAQISTSFQIVRVTQIVNGVMSPAPLEGLNVRFNYFNPPGSGRTPKFLSICAQMPGQTNFNWVAKNIYLDTFPAPRQLNRNISLSKLGVPDNVRTAAVKLFALQTNSAIVTPITPSPSGFISYNCPLDSIFMFDSRTRSGVSPIGPDYFFADFAGGVVVAVTRGPDVPNVELNDSLHPAVKKGYAGDHNACGPASVANSLAWIQTAIPAVGNDGLTERQRLEELSELMGRKKKNDGAEADDILQGKVSFIANHGLKLKVEYLAASGNFDDDLKWLKAQYDAGQDIEMDYSFIDEDGNKRGHAIVLTGLTITGKVPQISFADDADQKHAGGTDEHTVELRRSPDGHISFLRNGSTRSINHFYAESYDPNVGAYTDPMTHTTSTVFCQKQEKDCRKGSCPAIIIFYGKDTMPVVTYPLCGGDPCCNINKLFVLSSGCAAKKKENCRGDCPQLFTTKTAAKRGNNPIQGKCDEAAGCKCVYDVKGKIPGLPNKENRRIVPEVATDKTKLKIYPNPARQQINIEVAGYEGNYRLQVISILGQQVVTKSIVLDGHELFTLDVSGLANGMYYLMLRNDETQVGGSFVKD